MRMLQRCLKLVYPWVTINDLHFYASCVRGGEVLRGFAAREILASNVQPLLGIIYQLQRFFVDKRLAWYSGIDEEAGCIIEGNVVVGVMKGAPGTAGRGNAH